MKVKQQPDDFYVEELTDVQPGAEGAFAFYRLEKRGWTTPDALALIRRRWQVEPARLAYGGLKDRHAHTVQFLSIFHGPRRNLEQQNLAVRHLGQLTRPYGSTDIRANRFRLAIRDINPAGRAAIEARLAEVTELGVPSYFDDQRFGSVTGPDGEFIARLLVRGQFEEALRLALVAPYEFDRAEQKTEKRLLATHWGDWEKAKAVLPRGHARSLVDYLRVHPGDFRGAVVRLRPELRGLYLSAYQSHLWNRILARWLERHCPPGNLREINLRLGPVPFPTRLAEPARQALDALQLPLPTARWHPEPGDERLELVESVLAEEGLTLAELRIKGVRDLFFSRGDRAALCRPQGLSGTLESDDRHPGRLCLRLGFDLPRGSYATLLVKAVTVGGQCLGR